MSNGIGRRAQIPCYRILNSLFLKLFSLLIRVGNCWKNNCGAGVFRYATGSNRPEIAKFPVNREFGRRLIRSALQRQPGTSRFYRISILNLTDEDDPIDEISRIEAQLEVLAEVSERCRKIILVSKAAIASGVVLPLFMVLGLFGSNQVAVLGSIAVVLGGIVSLGSNVSTLQQTMAAISAAEAARSDLIGRIELRVVGEEAVKRI